MIPCTVDSQYLGPTDTLYPPDAGYTYVGVMSNTNSTTSTATGGQYVHPRYLTRVQSVQIYDAPPEDLTNDPSTGWRPKRVKISPAGVRPLSNPMAYCYWALAPPNA